MPPKGRLVVLRGRNFGRELQHAAEDAEDAARGGTRLGPALDQDQVLPLIQWVAMAIVAMVAVASEWWRNP